ncbi:Glyoxalase/Bleomycin resistance protein/Dihydroxybiphenyl dioxygenase [Xylaria bambusicola]|uniref:Glyoxalase/Bleomycin resistance protein/Dihydroxybiphenyl dioxygenase n=1 Tax=Xylaria bambusicola TaxID=326684 RepID=UPI002008D015|nr:Glyoxalase/Bleomycin resistance protein/Dihydroxybiphenyl dioxygenase [Xylaria bambusicola]KAI0505699.1 Glyoxalase/Bleomycin resistance protein/Dihydroxybiphenyl dioxygenase [Xylaria bambusicola]
MTTESKPSKVLSPKALAHVVLQTPQVSTMAKFYKTFLGAEASFETDSMTFLTYDEEHHRVAIIGMPGLPGKVEKSAGLHHVAFTYPTLSTLFTAYKQRKAFGILPVWCTNHGVTTSLYYRDPDGNRLETQVDNFDTNEETTAFLTGPEMRENPLGVDFDPEDLIRKLESGVPEAEIKKRPNIGPRGIEDIPAH